MNPHIGAAMWIIATFVGFVVWWPIGAAFLAAITITALHQQRIGYQLPPPQQPQQHHVVSLPPLYFDAAGKPMNGR